MGLPKASTKADDETASSQLSDLTDDEAWGKVLAERAKRDEERLKRRAKEDERHARKLRRAESARVIGSIPGKDAEAKLDNLLDRHSRGLPLPTPPPKTTRCTPFVEGLRFLIP